MLFAPQLLLLAASVEEKPMPVIDIDGTVVVQFGLFVVMYFVLKHLLFEPYLAMRQQRSEGIEGARHHAANMETRAAEMERDYDRRFGAAKSRAEDERGRTRAQAQEREREVLAEARGVAQARLGAARHKLAADLQAAGAELQRQAQPLARQMVSKILGREV